MCRPRRRSAVPAAPSTDQKKAADYLRNDFATANNAYWGTLEAMAKFQGDLMDKEAVEANDSDLETRKQVIMLSVAAVLAVLAALVIASIITVDLIRRLGGEPGYAVDLMQSISKGDLSREVRVKPNDSNSLLFAVREMTTKLQQVISGQRGVVEAANRGNFEARVGLAGLQGFQREMAEGLNQLAQTTGASIADVVRVMGAVSEEQSAGLAQINQAISQLSQTSQRKAAGSEELASTSEQMSSQAEELQQTMGFFKVPGARPLAQRRGPPKAVLARAGARPMELAGQLDEANFSRF